MDHLLLNTHGIFEKVLSNTYLLYLVQIHIENRC